MAIIIGNNRSNTLIGTGSADIISGRGGNDRIIGNGGDDLIQGGDGNDRIDGGRGNDVIDGGSGSDVIDGGRGNDLILGGDGSDVIDGGSGNDQILAGSGNDIVDGGSGDDSIDGGSGNDVIGGGSGNDVIEGGSGNDVVDGGSGNDSIDGGTGNDIVLGGSGNDILDGGSGNDFLSGGSGDDVLIGGAGSDQLTGGSGSDRFVFRAASDSPATGGWDRITDFSQGRDKIDLSDILGPTNLAWGDRTATVNGVWYQNLGFRTFVFVDDNGDGRADLTIELTNTFGLRLTPNDFIGVGGGPVANNAPVVANTDVTGAVTELLTPVGNLTDSGTIAFTDADVADIHSVSAVTPSAGALGSLTASVSTDTTGSGLGGVVTWNYSVAAANVEFVAAGQHLIETFTFNVLDGHGGSVARTVTVDIAGTDDAPVITSHGGGDTASLSYVENSTEGVNTVTATDPDASDTLTYSIVGGADADKFLIDPVTHMLAFISAPNFEAPTDADGNNIYEVTVRVTDGGGLSDTQAISVTVTNANDAPVAVADTLAATEDTPVTYTAADLLGNDTDVDNTNAQLTIASVTSGSGGTAVLNNDGTVTFTPNANFNGAADFSYTTSDGTDASAPVTVTVNVAAVNDAPVITVHSGDSDADTDSVAATITETNAGLTASGTLSVTDADQSDTVTSTVHSVVLSGTAGGLTSGDVLGMLTLTPASIAADPGDIQNLSWLFDSGSQAFDFLAVGEQLTLAYTVMVDDGHAGTDTQTVTITIDGTNDATGSDTVTATDDIVITNVISDQITIPAFALLANDSDSQGHPLHIGTVTNAALETSGDVTIVTDSTPRSFDYTASDGNVESAPAHVTVSTQDGVVMGAEDAPLNEILIGGGGDDFLEGFGGDDFLFGGAGADVLFGDGGNDAGNDTLVGGDGDDLLLGFAGADTLFADAGNDTLVGGDGDDHMHGGAGADIFDYNAISDAGTAGDIIADFNKAEGDQLDLQDLLANFSGYTPETAFSGGYLSVVDSADGALVQVDSDGPGGSDAITLATLSGITANTIDAGDFIL